MDLIYFVLAVAIIGFIVYLIITHIPMPEIFKQVLIVVCAVVILLWLLRIIAPVLIAPKLLP